VLGDVELSRVFLITDSGENEFLVEVKNKDRNAEMKNLHPILGVFYSLIAILLSFLICMYLLLIEKNTTDLC